MTPFSLKMFTVFVKSLCVPRVCRYFKQKLLLNSRLTTKSSLRREMQATVLILMQRLDPFICVKQIALRQSLEKIQLSLLSIKVAR